MASILVYALEMLCYSGNFLSGIIAWNIWRIQETTLINKVFMVYFAIDCLIGNIDPFYLFKLYKERSGVHEIYWQFWAQLLTSAPHLNSIQVPLLIIINQIISNRIRRVCRFGIASNQAGKHLECIQSEPCPLGACSL